MATSYLKKNKNMMSRIMSIMKKQADRDLKISCYTRLGDEAFGLRYDFYVAIPFKDNLKTFEDKGMVYIGVDLTKAKIDFVDTRQAAFNLIMNAAFPYYGNANSEILNLIGNYSNDDVRNNNDIIYNSEAFRRVEKVLSDICNNGEAVVTLGEKEWPRLSDRDIVPLLIINVDKSQYDYYKEVYSSPSSYREGREKGDMSTFNDRDMRQAANSANRVIRLTSSKIKHKYIDNP